MNTTDIAANHSFNPEQYLQKTTSYLEHPVLFHIIHIINMSKSRLNQLDEWQEYDNPNSVSVDRLSKSKSRNGQQKIIREVNIDDDMNTSVENNQSSKDIYKLLLRDRDNNYCYAYEHNDFLPFLREKGQETGTPLSVPLGGRLIVNRGTLISNGVLLIGRAQCQYLGVDQNDKELFDQINSGIVKKYIEILNEELNVQ